MAKAEGRWPHGGDHPSPSRRRDDCCTMMDDDPTWVASTTDGSPSKTEEGPVGRSGGAHAIGGWTTTRRARMRHDNYEDSDMRDISAYTTKTKTMRTKRTTVEMDEDDTTRRSRGDAMKDKG